MVMTVLAVLTPNGPALADPQVPLLRADDEGVLRGESVFETVRVAGHRPAFLAAHLQRLGRSASRLGMDLPTGWEPAVALALRAWDLPDATLRLVATKGGTAYALLTTVPTESVRVRREGLHAVTLTWGVPAGLRAQAPWLLGGVKSTSYATNMAAVREAVARGAEDVVLVSGDGQVLEGPTANVAWVRGGTLITPPDEVGILPGITMAVVLQSCAELGVPVQVRRGAVDELERADEVLLTGSVRGVVPVLSLNGQGLGAGPITARLSAAFERRVLQDSE